MTVYEQNAYLYGFDKLHGKPATLYYLPTKRSRKWRKAWSVKSLGKTAEAHALHALNTNKWFTYRFEKGLS